MVVDDEVDILEVYRSDLQDHSNYQVEYYDCTRKALEEYRKAPYSYSLVVVDLHMPLKSGEALIFDMHYLNPSQNIAVLSADPAYLKIPANFKVHVYQKPFQIEKVVSQSLIP